MTSSTVKKLYWTFTILFAALMIFTSIPGARLAPDAIKFLHDYLGYPVYFIQFISIAKLLGIAALLIPGFPRIKEWAYAGLFFDLIGAVYSLLSIAKPDASMLFMILFFGLGILSYIFYHKKLQLS